MEEILWHRRKSRRQTEKTNFFLSSGSLMSTRPRIFEEFCHFTVHENGAVLGASVRGPVRCWLAGGSGLKVSVVSCGTTISSRLSLLRLSNYSHSVTRLTS